MSAFGFMSFAMAVVNAVINNANNVNSNNNNNNNNDNNNNNNLGNINVANSNNNVNNMNMVTAGRRRRYMNKKSNSTNKLMKSSGEFRKANHTYQVVNKPQAVDQNRAYDMVNGVLEWKDGQIVPIDNISIFYINKKDIKPHNALVKKEGDLFDVSLSYIIEKTRMLKNRLWKTSGRIKSLAMNTLTRSSFLSHSISLYLHSLWSKLISKLGRRRRKRQLSNSVHITHIASETAC